MIEYSQNKHIPDEYIIAKLSEFWNEDMPKGDLATECTVSKKTHFIHSYDHTNAEYPRTNLIVSILPIRLNFTKYNSAKNNPRY